MVAPVSYFGIRHHGPGSARRLVEALDALQPAEVLIECPSDLTEHAKLASHKDMVPPVALLAYNAKMPEQATFLPFAVYSPEYQAMRWASQNGADIRFIDLPAATSLSRDHSQSADVDTDNAHELNPQAQVSHRDPIGDLASAAGYEDGESWWNDLVEVSAPGQDLFAQITEAMTTLREDQTLTAHEARREAHMRLQISASAKTSDGPVAVVCGAWHVPALLEKHTAKDDRVLLKGLPKVSLKATWVPWSSLHLSRNTGYGAGVMAPRYYDHIWAHGTDNDAQSRWIADIAGHLRADGHLVSTASLIEVVRLARNLAALRGRPSPGFEETREASISCLLSGEALPWTSIESALLLGSDVGQVPSDQPLSPLLEDLGRLQKSTRMKPEAGNRDLSLDLRSESGLARSTLLHRLTALGVAWGKMTDAGKSRGTFRERWILNWAPEHSIELVENLVYGSTIEKAAQGRLLDRITKTQELPELAEIIQFALTAQLPVPAEQGTDLLMRMAARSNDCRSLLATLPSLIETIRYGTARNISLTHIEALARKIAILAAIALPTASRNLDAEAGRGFYETLNAAHVAIKSAGFGEEIETTWLDAISQVSDDAQATPLVRGLALRLRYESNPDIGDQMSDMMSRALSPGTPVPEAADFFEGFFLGAGARIAHDVVLRDAVDVWMQGLDEEIFTESLPLFRRVFSSLQRPEKTLIIEKVIGGDCDDPGAGRKTNPLWPAHLDALTTLLSMKGGAA
jgi:hypothetical protein